MKNGKTRKPPHCIAEDCKRELYSRGLCEGHYQLAYKRIQRSKGKITWAMLEARGAAIPRTETWLDRVLK